MKIYTLGMTYSMGASCNVYAFVTAGTFVYFIIFRYDLVSYIMMNIRVAKVSSNTAMLLHA